MRATSLFMLMAALALCAGGCGKKVSQAITEKALERQIEKETGGKVDLNLDEGHVKMHTADGEQIEFAGNDEGVTVPEDFPKDVYVYEGAKATASMKSAEGWMLTLTTADPVAKVAGAIKAKMTAAGWGEKSSINADGMTMLEYAKGDQAVTFSVHPQGETTEIILMLQKAEAEAAPEPAAESETPADEEAPAEEQ